MTTSRPDDGLTAGGHPERDRPTDAPPAVLEGVRVVSVALNVPGPVAVARLADYGAQVTTVLPPGGDPLALYSPEWFADLHAGQDVETLDLKSEPGQARMTALLDAADLLVTSSRPSALRRLGLDAATLLGRHPRLCQIDIVGHPGVEAEIAGHDLTYQAAEGLLHPPSLPTTLAADLFGAERAVAESLAVLRLRDATGRGHHRQIALSEAARDIARPLRYGLTTADGILGGANPSYAVYATSDGWVALAALEPHFERRAHDLLGVDGTAAAYAAAFATRTAREWQDWADAHDVPLRIVDPR